MTSGFATMERQVGVRDAATRLNVHGRLRYRTAMMAALALLLAGLGYVVQSAVTATRDFRISQSTLDRTRSHTASVRADLTSALQDLNGVMGEIGQVTVARSSDTAELQEAQAALANAQEDVSSQGSAISALHSCLTGVEQAMNALSVGDQNSAVGALKAVSTSCNAAVTSDG
jgi:chromosome segregation ATPase